MPESAPLDRYSPLYCRYNGLLLGQYIACMNARYAADLYPVRRARLQEFLAENAIECEVPEQPFDLFSNDHADWLRSIILGAASRSADLSEFALLGMQLIFYGHLATVGDNTAPAVKAEIERLRRKHGLAAPDYAALIPSLSTDGTYLIDSVLSSALEYLADSIDRLAPEEETAFVIMPFSSPYAGYFSSFYRPTLERAGVRCFRAWGGLSHEDYCGLLLKLIEKSGMVLADISEPNQNVFYEIGAAHALGRVSLLIRNEHSDQDVPANIGHDAVLRYDPQGAHFPRREIRNLAVMVHALRAAGQDGRVRIRPDALVDTIEAALTQLDVRVPPNDAEDAFDRAMTLYQLGNYVDAEPIITHAISHGANGAREHFARGLIRARSGASADAIGDFDEAKIKGDDSFALYHARGIARYVLRQHARAENDFDAAIQRDARSDQGYLYRGLARVLLGKFADALDDFDAAAERGADSAELHGNRAYALIRLGEAAQAARHLDRAEILDPGRAYNHATRANLLLAQGQTAEAAAEMARALSLDAAAGLQFEMAIIWLCDGNEQMAERCLDAGLATANRGDIEVALRDFDFWWSKFDAPMAPVAHRLRERMVARL